MIIREFERFVQEYSVEYTDYNEEVLKGVLALLKAQEPRVMTLDEVVNSDAPVIVDSYDMPLYYASFEPEFSNETRARFYTLGEEGFTNFLIEDYNKANMWRCWTSRPTDEQREAIPWN